MVSLDMEAQTSCWVAMGSMYCSAIIMAGRPLCRGIQPKMVRTIWMAVRGMTGFMAEDSLMS